MRWLNNRTVSTWLKYCKRRCGWIGLQTLLCLAWFPVLKWFVGFHGKTLSGPLSYRFLLVVCETDWTEMFGLWVKPIGLPEWVELWDCGPHTYTSSCLVCSFISVLSVIFSVENHVVVFAVLTAWSNVINAICCMLSYSLTEFSDSTLAVSPLFLTSKWQTFYEKVAAQIHKTNKPPTCSELQNFVQTNKQTNIYLYILTGHPFLTGFIHLIPSL